MQARKLTNPLDRCRPDIVLETCSMSSRTFPAGCNKVVTHAVVVWKDGRSCTDLSTHVTDCCHPCNTRQLIHAPPRWFTCPQAVTHLSTNRARCRVTSFQPKRVTNYATPPTTTNYYYNDNDDNHHHHQTLTYMTFFKLPAATNTVSE